VKHGRRFTSVDKAESGARQDELVAEKLSVVMARSGMETRDGVLVVDGEQGVDRGRCDNREDAEQWGEA